MENIDVTQLGIITGFVGFIFTLISVWGVSLSTKVDSVAGCISNYSLERKPHTEDASSPCESTTAVMALIIFIPLYLIFLYVEYSLIDYIAFKLFGVQEAGGGVVTYLLINTFDSFVNAIKSASPFGFLITTLSVTIPLILVLGIIMPVLRYVVKILELLGKNSFYQGIGLVIAFFGLVLAFLGSS